jgi:hypothetical protein
MSALISRAGGPSLLDVMSADASSSGLPEVDGSVWLVG